MTISKENLRKMKATTKKARILWGIVVFILIGGALGWLITSKTAYFTTAILVVLLILLSWLIEVCDIDLE